MTIRKDLNIFPVWVNFQHTFLRQHLNYYRNFWNKIPNFIEGFNDEVFKVYSIAWSEVGI